MRWMENTLVIGLAKLRKVIGLNKIIYGNQFKECYLISTFGKNQKRKFQASKGGKSLNLTNNLWYKNSNFDWNINNNCRNFSKM